jgi:hypothetical protein
MSNKVVSISYSFMICIEMKFYNTFRYKLASIEKEKV